MRAHDVAVYVPGAATYYGMVTGGAGGAERQSTLLARGLQAHGLRTAHIVFPMPDGPRLPGPRPTLIVRPPLRDGLREPPTVWRSLARAEAETYIFRGAKPLVAIGAAFCRANSRRMIFSAASDADFTDRPTGAPGWRKPVFDLGVRGADTVVVQSAHQVAMARKAFPGVERVVEIPSLTEPATPTSRPGEAFLWIGRLVDIKRPLEYLRLAEAMPEARFWMLATTWAWDQPKQVHREIMDRARGLENFEILDPMPHPELMDRVDRAAAIVNTSVMEGMPNVWLEGWSRGVPALTLDFDPDGRIAARGLGLVAGGDFDAFVEAARELWQRREDRRGFATATLEYIRDVHSAESVSARWAEVIA